MGQKILRENEFLEIKSKFHKISLSTGQGKEKNINKLYDDIESGLEYVGCSAIEDKLQEGVPETIETLIKANIRIWILTGDKKETAIEIGKSCRLIKDYDMEQIDLASSSDKDYSKEEFEKLIEGVYRKYIEKKNSISYNSMESYDNISKNYLNFNKNLYLVIDGKNLAYVLSDLNLRKKFFRIGMMAISVICCRVSPKQKSEVVKMAKQNSKFITLSIGDGANDVPMIMEAHIGIGISGKEGTQAVRSADYAIGQFQFLKRLLLVHGRWGYRRISYFVCYYFYKNILLVLTEIYFVLFNGFSGQIFFPDLLPLCYNAFWTSWPCIFAYSIERDVDDEKSLKYPILYKAGQENFYFSMRKFWTWIVFAVIHGAIVFFAVSEGTKETLDNDGSMPDHWFNSTLCFSCIVHIVTFKIFVDLMYWNLLSL
jgi:phospholipid-translocating P-type ATPase (flippase)